MTVPKRDGELRSDACGSDNDTMSNAHQDICYGRVGTRNSVQEWYESASRAAGRRTRALRKLGFRAVSAPMGEQVTSVGRVRMTLVTVWSDDGREVPMPERIERC